MRLVFRILITLCLLLLPTLSWAVRPAEPSIDLVNNSPLTDMYFNWSHTVVEGSTQLNTRVIFYVDGVEYARTDSASGSWNVTLELPQRSSAYVFTAVSFYPAEVTPDYSAISEQKNVFIDYTKPAISVKNSSVWQGDSYYVRDELRSLYADVSDVGGSGFGYSPTFSGTITDLTQAGNPTINGTATYANNRISFIPKNGYTTGSFTNNHVYRMDFMIMDRAGNTNTSQRSFVVDYTTPALPDLTTYPATPNLYKNVFIYDPAHVPNAGVGEPSSNFPLNTAQSQAIAGDNRFVGFVRFFNNTIIQTNPTRIIFKFTPGDWGVPSTLKLYAYGDYIDNWNNWGGWYNMATYNNGVAFPPTANKVDNVNVGKPDANGWMATRAYVRPQGVYVDNWFYWRDAALNRIYTPHLRYLCTAGPPKAPSVYASTMFKNGDSKIPPDSLGGDRTIQPISGEVMESGDTQNVEVYLDTIDAAHLIGIAVKPPTNYVGSDKSYTVYNNKGLKYNANGVSTLYVRASNQQFGAGPYTYWWAAYADNTPPQITNAYVPGAIVSAYSSANVPSQIQADVIENPYLVWNSIFGLNTNPNISPVSIVGYDKFNNRTNYSVNGDNLVWYGSDNYYSAKLDLAPATLDQMKISERTYYADVTAMDLYGLSSSQSKMKLFAIDNTPPDYVRILPSEGDTVNALEKFTAIFQDPLLAIDGSASSGLSFGSGSKYIGNTTYSQLYIYKIIAGLKPSASNRFDIPMPNDYVDPFDTVSGKQVLKDHAGHAIPTGTPVEVWDANDQAIDTASVMVSNTSGNVEVDTRFALDTNQYYSILYPIPYYYSSDRVSQLASIPFEPVNMIGNYKVKIVGVDKVGNLRAFNVNYNIRFDPPQGLFWLTELNGKDTVTANGLDMLSLSAGPIFTKSGQKVKPGTVVTLYTDKGEFVDGQGNTLADQEPLLPGLQVKTLDTSGVVTFNLKSVQVGATGVYAKTEAGSAQTSVMAFTFVPDLISKLVIVFPGQHFVSTNGTVTGTAEVPTAGVTFSVSVFPLDYYNHPVTSISDKIRLYSADTYAHINGLIQMAVQSTNNAGEYIFQVNEKVAGSRTYTATDLDKIASNITKTGTITIKSNVPKRLLALQQGQLIDPKNVTGKKSGSWNYDAGFSIPIYVTIADDYFNAVSGATADVHIQGSWDTQFLATTLSITDSDNMFSVVEAVPSAAKQVYVQDIKGYLLSDYSTPYVVNSAPATKLQILIPRQYSLPNIGSTSSVLEQKAGVPFVVTVNAVDDYFNLDVRVNSVVLLNTGVAQSQAKVNVIGRNMTDGVATFSLTEYLTATDRTLTSEVQFGYPYLKPARSASYNVQANVATKLLVLAPGETYDPSSPEGKIDIPDAQVKSVPFVVTVNAVDDYFNFVASGAQVSILALSGDTVLSPTTRTLVGGIATFTVLENIPVVDQQLQFDSPVYPRVYSQKYLVVNSFEALKYEVVMPGQTFSGGIKSGDPDIQVAGEYFTITVNAMNSINGLATVNQTVRLIGPTTYNPVERTVLDSAVVTFSVQHEIAGSTYIKARSENLQGKQVYTITPNVMVGVKLVMPGQTLQPGTLTGIVGTPDVQTSMQPFQATVYSVDSYGNHTYDNLSVTMNTDDPYAVLSTPLDLVDGVALCPVTERVAVPDRTLMASISAVTRDARIFTVLPGPFAGLQCLYPGQTSVPGSETGLSGSDKRIIAGQPFIVTINAVDQAYNSIGSYQGYAKLTLDTEWVTVDQYEKNFVNGTVTFSITQYVATPSHLTVESSIYKVVHPYTVSPGEPSALNIVGPGQTLSPGVLTGSVVGELDPLEVGKSFQLQVYMVDTYNNVVSTVNPYSITVHSALPYGTIDFPTKNFFAGTVAFSLSEIVATVVSYSFTAENGLYREVTVNVLPASANGILLLVPGEVQRPGYLDVMEGLKGKTGTPNTERAGEPFLVTVNLVDRYFNTVTLGDTNHLIGLFSRDDYAPAIPNRIMKSGVVTFSITMATATTLNTRTLVGIDNSTLALDTPFQDKGLPGFVVLPGKPAVIKVTSNMRVTADGVSSSNLKLTVQDLYRNVIVSQSLTVLPARPQDVVTTVSYVTDVSGNAYFSVRSTKAGDAILSLTSIDPTSGITVTGSALITFVGDTSNPSSVNSQVKISKTTCVPRSSDYVMITIVCLDVYGNPISGQTVSVTSSRGVSDSFSIVNDVTNQDGEAFIRISSQYLGSATLNVRNQTHGQDLVAYQIVNFVPDVAHPSTENSILEIVPQVLTVGKAVSVKVTLYDNYGNLITGNPVTIYTDRGPTFDIVTTINNLTGAIAGADYAAFRLLSYKAGDLTVLAKDMNSGYVLASKVTHEVRFDPGEADVSVSYLEVTPSTVAADGEATAAVTVWLQDMYSNPIRYFPLQFFSSRAILDTLSTLNALTDKDGKAVFAVSSTVIGNSSFSAVINDTATLNHTASVRFSGGKISAADSPVQFSSQTVTANGQDAITVNISLHDRLSNPLSGITLNVLFSWIGAALTTGNTVTSDADGLVTIVFHATKAGTVSLNIDQPLFNVVITDNVLLNVVVDPLLVSSLNSYLVVSPSALTAGDSQGATLSVHLRDIYDNPIPACTVNLSSIGVTLNVSTLAPMTDAQGIATMSFTTQYAGIVTFSAVQAVTHTTLNQQLKYTVLPDYLHISPTLSTVEMVYSIQQQYQESYANGKDFAMIRAVIEDVYGNKVNTKLLSAFSDRPSSDVVKALNSSNTSGYDGLHDGQCVFYVASTRIGPSVIHCLDIQTGTTFNMTATINFVADRFDPSTEKSIFAVSPSEVIANGEDHACVTFNLRDRFDNEISGNAIVLVSDRVGKDTISPASATTNTEGIVTFTVSSKIYGDVKLTLMDNTARVTMVDKFPILFKAEPIPATFNSEVKVNDSVMQVSSVAAKNQTSILVTVRDRFSNPLIGYLVEVTSNRRDDVLTPTASLTDAFGRVRYALQSRYAGQSMISAIHTLSGKLIGTTSVVFTNPATTSSVFLLDKDGNNKINYVLGLDSIYVSVIDFDQNRDSFARDTVSVNLINLTVSDNELVILTETDLNSGIFNNSASGVSTNFRGAFSISSNNIFEGTYKNKFKVVYVDASTPSDKSTAFASLDIAPMSAQWQTVAYLNQTQDAVLFRYLLDQYTDVEIWVYNLKGELVWRSLYPAGTEGAMTSEQNIVPWDMRDSQGKLVPNGVYLYRLMKKSNTYKIFYTGKVLIVR